MVSLDGETHENPLVGIARYRKTYSVGTRFLRKSRTLSACIAHVAALAEKPLVRLKARLVRMAQAEPEIAQWQERSGIGAVLDGLEMRTRHRGIVAQGWRRIGWTF